MKIISLLAAITFSLNLISQDHFLPYELNQEGLLFMSSIIESDLSKKELFKNSKKWMAKVFKDAKEVELYDDGDMIFGKGSATARGGNDWIKYNITIITKENKARIVIDNISIKMGDTNYEPLEEHYFVRGDSNKKPRTAFGKRKSKWVNVFNEMITSWQKDVQLSPVGGYSDF